MSSRALTWVRTQMPRRPNEQPDSDAKHILWALASLHNREHIDGRVFPKQVTIAELTGLGKSTVGAKLKLLDEQGYTHREHRTHPGGARRGQRTSDDIYLHLERPPEDCTASRPQPKALRTATVGKSDVTNDTPSPSDEAEFSPERWPDNGRAIERGVVRAPRQFPDRPADLQTWTVRNVVDEFEVLATSHAPTRVGQVDVSALTRAVREFSRQANMASVAQGARDFFEDPRNVHDIGTGAPLWLRFLKWFPTQQARLEVVVGTESDAADLADQQALEAMRTQRRKF